MSTCGKLRIWIVFLVTLIYFTTSAKTSPDCQTWFLRQEISAKNRSCYIDCAVAPVNMGNYMCHNQCDELCSPIDCRNPPEDQCLFYSQCVESDTACGKNGYALNYGEKYCLRFLGSDGFSDKGQLWRTKTMVCLQKALVSLLKQPKMTNFCENLEAEAFDSHVSCYTQEDASFCWLPFSDWETIGFDILDFRDIVSWNGIKQVHKIMFVSCRDVLLKRLVGNQLTNNALLKSDVFDLGQSEADEIKAKLKFIDDLEGK